MSEGTKTSASQIQWRWCNFHEIFGMWTDSKYTFKKANNLIIQISDVQSNLEKYQLQRGKIKRNKKGSF